LLLSHFLSFSPCLNCSFPFFSPLVLSPIGTWGRRRWRGGFLLSNLLPFRPARNNLCTLKILRKP
jgi:hypothetical protein